MSPKLQPCPSFPGYSVSADGRVFSHRRRGCRSNGSRGSKENIDPNHTYELAQNEDRKGYLRVSIRVNRAVRPVGVHQMVLDAFLGARPLGCVSRHLDGNPKNNRPENLAYGTHSDNARDRIAHGRYAAGERHHNAKLTDRQAGEIKALRAEGRKVKDLALTYRVSVSVIESIIYGKSRIKVPPIQPALRGYTKPRPKQ